MSDGTVQYKFNADVQQAMQNITKLEKKLDDQENKLRQVSRTSRKGASEGDADFKKLASGAAQFATGIGLAVTGAGLLQAAIGRVKGEFADLLGTQQKAAQAQQTYAQAFDAALLNAGGMPARELEKMLGRISDATGGDPRQVAIAASNAFSARGNLSNQQVEEGLTTTFKLTRNLPNVQAPFSGAILDLQKKFNADAEQAAGFLLATANQARVTDQAKVAGNVIPGVLNVAAAGGDSPREASALIAAITQATGDFTGATGATAAVKLDRQMEVALPDLANLTARLDFLEKNPAAREAFFKGGKINGRDVKPASFEVNSITAIEDLLSGGGVKKAYRDAFGALPELEKGAEVFQATLKEFAATSFRENNNLEAAFNTGAEAIRIEDIEGAKAAITRQGLNDVLEASGIGKTGRDIANAQFEFASRAGTDNPLGTTIDLLETKVANLRQDRVIFNNGMGGEMAMPQNVPASRENMETAAKLDKVVEVLERIHAGQAAQTGKLQQKQINRAANTE